MTSGDLAFVLGAVLSSLALVHLFLLIAGVRFGGGLAEQNAFTAGRWLLG
jgi:hypothetical protein